GPVEKGGAPGPSAKNRQTVLYVGGGERGRDGKHRVAERKNGEGGEFDAVQPGERQFVDGGAAVQPDVQDVRGPGGERGERGVSAAGDGPGDFRAVQERGGSFAAEGAVWHLPGGQGVSE